MKFLKVAACLSLAFGVMTGAAQADEEFAFSSQGDASKGKRVFNKCRACHNLTSAKKPKTGPNLDNIFGREAASSATFTRYSSALKESGIVWTEADLNAWLTKPKEFLPGNKMVFAGLKKEADRNNVIAYLREATVSE